MVTEGNSNIVISVPGDNGDQARQLGSHRAAAVPPGGPAGPARPPRRRRSRRVGVAIGRSGSASGHRVGRLRGVRLGVDAGASRPPAPSAAATASAPTASGRGPDRRARRPAPPVTQEQATAQLATLTCARRIGPARRSTGPRTTSPLHAGRHGQVPARPGRHRGHRSHDADRGHAVRPRASGSSTSTSTLQGFVDVGQVHRRQRRQAGRASPWTARSSRPPRSTARSPVATPRSPAASTRRRPPSWPTSSSTARCR